MAQVVRQKVPHLMSLADLSAPQIERIIMHARFLKQVSLPWLAPSTRNEKKLHMPSQALFSKSIALLFNKRSTRTRVAAETAATLLGGRALFLGKEDIQLGVNESVRDSARVIGGMCQGIFARVGEHEEIEVRPVQTTMMWFEAELLSRNLPNTLPYLSSTPCQACGTLRKFSPTC